MIHSAKPTVSPVAKIVFCFFCLIRFEKWGRTDGRRTDGRTDVRTDDICENNDPYRPWLWVGRVDQQIRGPESSFVEVMILNFFAAMF